MVCDLDNTLVPHYTRFPNKDVTKFIKGVKDAGIEFVLLSNNVKTRVGTFAGKAGVDDFYANGRKPFKRVAKKILDTRNYSSAEVIFVGDQIIMDILVANRLKCESILVQPLVSTDYKMNSFNLFLEKRIYRNLERKNILRKGDFSSGNLGDGFELI